MTLSLRSLLLLGALAAGAFACAAPSEEEAAPADSAENEDELRAQKITEADDGKTIVVQEGRTFTVALGANATTGYEWKVVSTTRTLGYPYRSRYFADQSGAVGSGGEARFYWKTAGALPVAGKHAIELAYARGDGKPAKTVRFTIDVQPAGAASSVVKIGGASGQTFDVKVGQDILVELAGPQFLGWQVTSTSRSLGYPEAGWVQGDGAVGQSGHSTFLWKTKSRPISVEGSHKVVLEFDRGHGDGVSRFEFTANIK